MTTAISPRSRIALLEELRRLASEQGPNITLVRFRDNTGISRHIVYDRWGNWTNLRVAAGLPKRVASTPVYSSAELLAEFHSATQRAGRYPTAAEYRQISGHSWQTLDRRFGRKREVIQAYRTWLDEQPRETRPELLAGLTPGNDPAPAVPARISQRPSSPLPAPVIPQPVPAPAARPAVPAPPADGPLDFAMAFGVEAWEQLKLGMRPTLLLLLAMVGTLLAPASAHPLRAAKGLPALLAADALPAPPIPCVLMANELDASAASTDPTPGARIPDGSHLTLPRSHAHAQIPDQRDRVHPDAVDGRSGRGGGRAAGDVDGHTGRRPAAD